MLSLVSLLTLMRLVMIKSEAESADIIRVSKNSGDSVVLQSGLMGIKGVRWTHPHLLLNNRTKTCHHGRCELLMDGSLRFNRVVAEDSGNYTLEMHDDTGELKVKKTFLLQVEGGSSVKTSLLIFVCFLPMFLLLFFTTFFLLRKRRAQSSMTSGQKEDNIYMVMYGNHGNNGKPEEEEKKMKEEEPLYVPCNPLIAAEDMAL